MTNLLEAPWSRGPVAVLASGGLDSAILVGELAATAPRVAPIYVRFGLLWEEVERRGLERFLAALGSARVDPLRVFEMPIRPVYGEHWSTTGRGVPDADSADEAVFLPGRNLLLVAQASVWCHLAGVPTLALGPLAGNPFPDATDPFFDAAERAANLAVEGRLQIVRPYRSLSKRAVMLRGAAAGLPLAETFSCIRPVDGRHCGACNKCAERIRAFADAGLPDATPYAGGA